MASVDRDEIRKIVFGESDDEVRSQFLREFEGDIERFLDRVPRALAKVDAIAAQVGEDKRKAYSVAYLWNAANSLIASTRLLITGFQVPAGALMRHYHESIAMSLLVSSSSLIPDIEHLDKYPVHNAIDKVGQKKISAKLGIEHDGWADFKKIAHLYDGLSHSSAFALGAGSFVFTSGDVSLGGFFDADRKPAYQKEIRLRISAAERAGDTADHLGQLWSTTQ